MKILYAARSFICLTCLCMAGEAQVFTSVNAGNWGPIVAPDAIAAGFGSNLAAQNTPAPSLPLLTTLGGVTVNVTASNSAGTLSPLFFSSQSQVNFLVPSVSALGKGTATVTANGGQMTSGPILISNVAPAIFTANSNGLGVAAAETLRITANSTSTYDVTFIGGNSGYGTKPISLLPSTDRVFLILFGTGIRRHTLNPVQVLVGGVKVPVTYADRVSSYPGLDQVNVGPLPSSLGGKGDVNVALIVDGVPANVVTVNIQ